MRGYWAAIAIAAAFTVDVHAQIRGLSTNGVGRCAVELKAVEGMWVKFDPPIGQDSETFAGAGCKRCSPPIAVTLQATPNSQPGSSDDIIDRLLGDRQLQSVLLDQYSKTLSAPGCQLSPLSLVGARAIGGRRFIGVQGTQTCPADNPSVMKMIHYTHSSAGCMFVASVMWHQGELEGPTLAELETLLKMVSWKGQGN